MKLKQLMMLLLLLLTTSMYAQSDFPFEEVENKLPSEVTMQEMQQHTWRPSLRYGPGGEDEGDPSKETPLPLPKTDALALVLLAISSIIYLTQTKKKKNEI